MLELILNQEEGKTLEFKENANSLNKIIQTIIAFANTAGGTLVIGIKDKTKEVIGVKDILKEEERIASAIADSISPFITPNFQYTTWRKLDILIITVSYTPMPYYLKNKGVANGVYMRLGSTNRIADQATVAEIQRLALHQSFDELPNLRAKQDDLDLQEAKNQFSLVKKKFDLNVAKSLNLLVQHQSHFYPSNAAILLFAKTKRKFFPDAIIQCGCFSGLTKTQIIDQQDIEAGLPIAVEQVLNFITRNTSNRSDIGKVKRIDTAQYPPVVIREALMNAIVHADYSVKGAVIQVAIFSDRIEIQNPGALPYGLSLERALSGVSQLRNRVIGHVFRELGLIERWGSGLGRMMEICHEQGIAQPKFEELDHYFRVTIYHERNVQIAKQPWQKEIIEYLSANKYIGTKEAGKLWKVTDRTASTRLKKMILDGFLVEYSTGPYDPKKRFALTAQRD